MSNNPVPAFEGTKCDGCGTELNEGDNLYMTDDGRLCLDCAKEENYVCYCGNFKKAKYDKCFDCNEEIKKEK